MKNIKIKFDKVSDVYDFIAGAQKCIGGVTVSQKSYCVDGKSAMGIFALNLREEVCVKLQNESDAKNFEGII